MNILMISTDRGLLDSTSRVSERFRLYATLFDSVHVIVFSIGNFEPISLAPNVHIYPTNSVHKLLYVSDAIRISRSIVHDMVSGQDPFETGLVAYVISKMRHSALHLQIHTDVYSDAFTRQSLLNRIRTYIASWLLPKAVRIRVVSKRIAVSLKKKFGTKIVEPYILPIMVEQPKQIVPMTFPFAQTVLMACRLEAEKRVDVALQAFARVRKEHPDAGLVIIGNGSLRAQLELQAYQLGIVDAVQFLGTQQDVFAVYAGADVYLHTAAYEGYGMTLIEAALSGLPIVTTDVGVVGDVLIDGGSVLVTQATPADIAIKIGLLLDDEALRAVLGGRAKEVAATHGMTTQQYAEAFRRAFTV